MMRWVLALLAQAAVLAVLLALGCSAYNREGPNVTCDDLEAGAINACREGIIASCDDGVNVAYEVCTEDQGGTTAEDICEAPWQPAGSYRCEAGPANVQIASVELADDSNGDGALNPGERATVRIFAGNFGGESASGLTAAFTVFDSTVSTLSCSAAGSLGSTGYCSSYGAGCNCEDVPNWVEQTLLAGEVGDYAILSILFVLADNAPLQPISFSVEFRDLMGNTWTDSFEIEVVP